MYIEKMGAWGVERGKDAIYLHIYLLRSVTKCDGTCTSTTLINIRAHETARSAVEPGTGSWSPFYSRRGVIQSTAMTH